MSAITIKKVETKKDLMTFIKFQWEIYKNDPYWVAPLIMERKVMLSKKKNPFFQHGDMELFLAEKDGKVSGRIAAIRNDLHNKIHNENIGFFGFFECINDQNVANALLDTAKNWVKEKGLTDMRGPASPSSNDEWGMLLEGYDDSPRLLMPYNPKYYITLCENYGLTKIKDLYAYKLENRKVSSSEKLIRGAEIVRQRNKVKIVPLEMSKFKEALDKVKMIYNKAWAPNWGFVPLTEDEINLMAKDLKSIVEPSLVFFAEIDGKTAGFALALLDYNQVFKYMNGRLFPFGFINLFTKKKEIKWARVITLGVIPEFQKRGLDSLLYYEVLDRAHKIGIDLGEASWILEDNEMMNRGAQLMNGELYKKYRVFQIPA